MIDNMLNGLTLVPFFYYLEFLQFQKLSVLISQISQTKGLPSNQIALMWQEKTLSENETLNSLGYIQGLVISRLNGTHFSL